MKAYDQACGKSSYCLRFWFSLLGGKPVEVVHRIRNLNIAKRNLNTSSL